MKILQILIVVALPAVFTACKSTSNTTARVLKGNKPFVISLERTSCFGTCPVYKVSIHSDGKIEYSGKDFSNPKGEYETYIPLTDVEVLRKAIIEANFVNLADTYDNMYISDLPSVITTLTIEGKQVKSIKNRYNPPPQLVKLEVLIDKIWRKELEIKE
ncbi:MAG: DUF6438 domain-containing protein [Thermaurantimonas sp.]|uniref:DUF6438 domain-containing protein n=1 Tax=Thermaurantimonas sp. TaxID=2681568 RepID=UPI003918DE92